MIKIKFIYCFLWFLSFNIAYSQNFTNGFQISGTSTQSINDFTIDSKGNYYIVGNFGGTLKFDQISFTAEGSFNSDIFIAKCDSVGKVFWAIQAGGSEADNGNAIAIDKDGYCYVTGYFSSNAFFDTSSIVSQGGWDIFLAKYDQEGNLIWLRQFNSKFNLDQGIDIYIDKIGNYYLTGNFGDKMSFNDKIMTSAGNTDVFIAKFDSEGKIIWTNQSGGKYEDSVYGMDLDSTNNIYITGDFNHSATFGNTNIQSNGGSDIYLAKYNSDGSFAWVKNGGGTENDISRSVCVDIEGNIILTGSFKNNASFDNKYLNSSGNYDVFVTKFSSSGDLSWVTSMGGKSLDYGISIVTDINSDIYISGDFFQETYFGDSLIVTNSNNGFFSKISSDGTILLQKLLGTGYVLEPITKIDEKGRLYFCGDFAKSLNIEKYQFAEPGQHFDSFIIRYNNIVDIEIPSNSIIGNDNFEILISPNPFYNEIKLLCNKALFGEIELFDYMGNLLLKEDVINQKEYLMHIKYRHNKIFILKYKDYCSNSVYVKKLIKQE